MARIPRQVRAVPQGIALPQGQPQGNAAPQGVPAPQQQGQAVPQVIAQPLGQPQGNAAPQGVPQPVQPPQRQIFLTPADANGNQFAYYFDARGNPRMVPGQQAPAAPLPGQQNQGYAPQGGRQPLAGGQPIVQQVVQPGNRLNIWKWIFLIIVFLLLAGIALIGVVTLGPRLVEGFKFAFLESDFSSICSNSAVYAPGWTSTGKAFVSNGETAYSSRSYRLGRKFTPGRYTRDVELGSCPLSTVHHDSR